MAIADGKPIVRRAKAIGIQRDPDIKSVDSLTFTSRDEQGRINWWDVSLPKTQYWHVHEALGRAYAYELLDLLNNPEAELQGGEAGFIMQQAAKNNSGVADGFFAVISEFLTRGDVSR